MRNVTRGHLVGYEHRMLAQERFIHDKVDAGGAGAGHSVIAVYEVQPRETGASLGTPDICSKAPEGVDPHTVDNFVSSLKRKPRWTHDSRFLLQTMRGVGYRMEIEP